MNPFFVIHQRSLGRVLILIFFTLIVSISPSYGFDPLDPYGNITISWDYLSDNEDRFDVKVSICNFQLFRHVERPGWKLSWAWKGDEVIWQLVGAEATHQGDCSRFKGQEKPHCCKKHPLIIDLLPATPFNKQAANCCKGGVLSSMTQDSTMYVASFLMNYNKPSFSLPHNISMPENFTLGLPGYSCGKPFQVPPTTVTKDGRRWTQVLETWNVTCVYSQIQAFPALKCCVSLSSFYNSTIVPCPRCSCSCPELPGPNCVKPGKSPSLLKLPKAKNPELEEPPPYVRCSKHMCPIRVHWHVKQSYKQYWRVKITITNLNFAKNYSQWNLVVLHPNLKNLTQVFSFNYHPLDVYGDTNDTGMFWGIEYYNDMLLSSGRNGNVQTEMILHKDAGNFTFNEGWAFPRKISFNGDECVMPSPEDYPSLPNKALIATPTSSILLFSLSVLSILLEGKSIGMQFHNLIELL